MCIIYSEHFVHFAEKFNSVFVIVLNVESIFNTLKTLRKKNIKHFYKEIKLVIAFIYEDDFENTTIIFCQPTNLLPSVQFHVKFYK